MILRSINPTFHFIFDNALVGKRCHFLQLSKKASFIHFAGEMELTSAVRSVSCSSTINKKCNGTASGTKDNAASKERDGCGSGNDGDDEEEYGTTTSKNNLAASGIKKSTIYTNNWQQPPPPQPQNGCPPRPTGPPSYR